MACDGPAMACDGVRVRYGGIEVLHGVRLAVAYGTFAALVGPNGAGKSTLLDWCAGAATEASATHGRLRIDGAAATGWSPARRARAGLRYVPFERSVFPGLSVLDNLRATRGGGGGRGGDGRRGGGADGGGGHGGGGRGGDSGAATTGSPDAILELFPELARLADRSAGVLSGGERQLLALACALHGPGRILLCDEPTHGLAPGLVERVLAELARTAREDGRAVLVAEPSADRVAAHADFLWPLDRGRQGAAVGA